MNKGRFKDPVSRDEMWALSLEMGYNRQSKVRDYWSTDSLLGVKDVQESMSLRRFWFIWANMHVVDSSLLSPSDGLRPRIRPVLDVLSRTFFEGYAPGQELSVDEAMIKYKGRVKKGKVKMPRKPIKEGFKVWCCCCACCGYLCTFQVYEGKPVDPATGKKVTEKGLTLRVVKDLLSVYVGLNHVVYMDNYFTSGPLIEALEMDGIYTTGTIKRRSQGYPRDLRDVKLSVGEYAAHSVGNITYFLFRDRGLVSFATNAFPETMKGKVARLPPNSRVLKYQSVPPCQPAYNRYMGAVDRLSQVRKSYGFDRKSKRYWMRGFMTFFDYAVNNAYFLYKHNCVRCSKNPKTLHDFRMSLVRLLLTDTRCRKRASRNVHAGASLTICQLVKVSSIGLKRGRCYHCQQEKRKNGCEQIRSTTFGCSNCKVRLCILDCFHKFHNP